MERLPLTSVCMPLFKPSTHLLMSPPPSKSQQTGAALRNGHRDIAELLLAHGAELHNGTLLHVGVAVSHQSSFLQSNVKVYLVSTLVCAITGRGKHSISVVTTPRTAAPYTYLPWHCRGPVQCFKGYLLLTQWSNHARSLKPNSTWW